MTFFFKHQQIYCKKLKGFVSKNRIGRTARADRTGEAITFINPKQVRNFLDIEKLIEKEVPKLDLPKGFEKAPEYKIQAKNKKSKKWRNFKKKHN